MVLPFRVVPFSIGVVGGAITVYWVLRIAQEGPDPIGVFALVLAAVCTVIDFWLAFR